MKGNEVREAFLKFFESKGHTREPSSSLVPENDPTLLYANAGMNQFKNLFLGAEKRSYSRATTSQKCLRITGKHNDFENVGVTARHHTFFEMLGNFSFGDYFKKDAILFAWEFITEVVKLPKDRLWITVFEDDDEAAELWSSVAGVAPERILRLGADDNFWAMGDTGPCGPCSEIHYFLGDDVSKQSEEDFRTIDGLYLEIWNLVFMQFNRSKDGELTPLPKPSIDTGMGLERITSIIQKGNSNYDTDLLRPIITRCEELSGFSYNGKSFEVKDLKTDLPYARDVAMRVIADHARSATFIVGDGVTPGSDGRGYILRRIIRRAIRHGRTLKFSAPFFKEMASVVIKTFGEAYPVLQERAAIIEEVLHAEELKFHETLDTGLAVLTKEVEKLKIGEQFPGSIAFTLHDSYGFPLDLTQDVLKQYKLTVDTSGFDTAMNAQRSRSREDRKSQSIDYASISLGGSPTKFLGYEEVKAQSELTHVAYHKGNELALLFRETPFYGESGGQVGDTGVIRFGDCEIEVTDTQKAGDGFFVHYGVVTKGAFMESMIGAQAELVVDHVRRDAIRRNHSATHIVHAALRKFLGDHIKQAGSKVDECRLRFDYSHFQSVSADSLTEIQGWVNEYVRNNAEVVTRVLPIEEAKKVGAVALFGEKYGDMVRVVSIGEQSVEFCGGIHVTRAGDIGAIIISSEESVSSGVRRIEALTGEGVFNFLADRSKVLTSSLALLKGTESEIPTRILKLMDRQKELEREIDALKAKLSSSQSADLIKEIVKSPSGVSIVATKVAGDPDSLKTLIDTLRVRLGSGVVCVVSEDGTLVAGATSDVISMVHVGNVIKQISQTFGGRGGGRADFAQAGGIALKDIDKALEAFVAAIP